MRLLHKYYEFLIYSIFGCLASLINIVSFNLFHNHWHLTMLWANTIAWLLANLFSFFANKAVVFKAGGHHGWRFIKEIILFLSQRIVDLLLYNVLMWLGVNWLRWSNFIVKTGDQLIVGIVNYLSTRAIFLHENGPLLQRMEHRRQTPPKKSTTKKTCHSK